MTYYSETAGRKSITDWLLTALQSNTPYNEWVSKLLNPVGPNDPDGFLIGVNWRGTVSASQTPALQAAQNTAQAFLGINLKCNSCHDSFISKWKAERCLRLAAYFSSEEKLRLYRCDIAQEQFATAGFLYPELNRELPSSSAEDRRATAAAIFTDPRNGRMPRTLVNRIWQRLLGRGIVANVDEMDEEPWSPEVLDWMASEFVASGYDMKALIATIVSSRTYQLRRCRARARRPGGCMCSKALSYGGCRRAVRRRGRCDHGGIGTWFPVSHRSREAGLRRTGSDFGSAVGWSDINLPVAARHPQPAGGGQSLVVRPARTKPPPLLPH